VRRIGLGGGRIPGCPDQTTATALLRRAIELGVNLIDTADLYGRGASETRIAEALRPYPADVVIATKGGFVPGADGPVPDGRPAHLRAACDASLQRLGLDAIDLYFLHTPDPAVPFSESLGALADLRAAGKIRLVGLSNVTAAQLALASSLLPVAAVQNSYNVRRRRRFGPDPVLAACERAGIAYVASQPLALGRLSQADEAGRRVAARHAATAGQVALAWLLAQSEAVVAIPGTTSVQHLEENLAAAELRLTREDLLMLERRPQA
jgi:aryl-alcohol dehydrogenase-like predicted oxidoreductase